MEDSRSGTPEHASPSRRKFKVSRLVTLPKKRDVYESFILKGLVSEMSYFTMTALAYSAAKIALGAVYYNDCSLEPRLLVYLLVSSVVMLLLYLPAITKYGQDTLGPKPYIRIVMGVQLVALVFGTYLINKVYVGRQQTSSELDDVTKTTCNDVIFKFTAATLVFEWLYISFSLIARGFVTILFHLVVFLIKTVYKKLLIMANVEKEKTS